VLKDNTVGCWVVFVHFFFFISIYLYIFTISLGYDRGTSYLPRVSDRTSSRPLTSIDRTHGPLAFSRSIVASMGRSRLAHMGHTLAQGKRLRSQGNDYDPPSSTDNADDRQARGAAPEYRGHADQRRTGPELAHKRKASTRWIQRLRKLP
jgi:hypothetical protein